MLALRSIKSVTAPRSVSRQTRVFQGGKRAYAGDASASDSKPFKHADLTIERVKTRKAKVPNSELVFGKYTGDHMLTIDWDAKTGWTTPKIHAHSPIVLDPTASVFHYALECFEGMKAYKDKDGKARLFRPMDNMARLNRSSARLTLPTFDESELLECIKDLVRVDAELIPPERGYSLYIRPTVISTSTSLGVHVPRSAKLFVITSPVGPYYKTGFKPVSLLADSTNVRACRGGTGAYKLGSNYAGTIWPALQAEKKGYSQVLWLVDDQVSEVGTMNLFFFWINEKGERELITPPLTDGTILPGVTRASVLDLARQWGEFKVTEANFTMSQVVKALQEGRILEAFGAGTAAVISPIERINYHDTDLRIPLGTKGSTQAGELAQRLLDQMLSIQYGEIPSPWSVPL
jgi:branched-chain amino acid aminotransferase